MSERTTSEIAVHNRMQLPDFRPGKDGPMIFSSGTMNIFSRVLRALTNPRVIWGERDDAQITDGNFLITLSRSSANESGSSRVSQYVLTNNSNGDYFVCRTLSVASDIRTTGATDIYIAKPFHLRRSPFDRDLLNIDDPGAIGTVDEITYDTLVESWDGATFSTVNKRWSYEYKSATFRIATNATDPDPDNWTSENQTIIPRLVTTTGIISPTIIYAANCDGLGIMGPGDVPITLLAQNDGWAWARTV